MRHATRTLALCCILALPVLFCWITIGCQNGSSSESAKNDADDRLATGKELELAMLRAELQSKDESGALELHDVTRRPDPGLPALGVPGDGAFRGASLGGGGSAKRLMDSHSGIKKAAFACESTTHAADAGPDKAEPGLFKPNAQSGLLTAGSFSDASEPEPFVTFARKLAGLDNEPTSNINVEVEERDPFDKPTYEPAPNPDNDNTTSPLAKLARLFVARPVVIELTNAEGRPVGNAKVVVGSVKPGSKTVELMTRTDGRAVILPAWDGLPAGDLVVTATPEGGEAHEPWQIDAAESHHRILLSDAPHTLPQQLDLAFVVDCTGSMADELEYLKVELKGIAEAVAKRFPHVSPRYALVVYRDEGDEYVTREFDFTDSLDTFIENLGKQAANGGGDTPEAVHDALGKAAGLSWRTGQTARVCFHLADASPHIEKAHDALKAADSLRHRGVALYPVASSGVDSFAELTMRAESLMTGAKYLFLTDDSGVGNAHAEPHFPHYNIEKLNALMTRLIATELSGNEIEPKPDEIVRRVTAEAKKDKDAAGAEK